jgi:hypothetical protein
MGCHEPERVAVVAQTAALVVHRPLWHGPSPATHGIHNPPKLDAVFGDELNRRYQTLARTCLNCQEGNCAAGTVIVLYAIVYCEDNARSQYCDGDLQPGEDGEMWDGPRAAGRVERSSVQGVHRDTMNMQTAFCDLERHLTFGRCWSMHAPHRALGDGEARRSGRLWKTGTGAVAAHPN